MTDPERETFVARLSRAYQELNQLSRRTDPEGEALYFTKLEEVRKMTERRDEQA